MPQSGERWGVARWNRLLGEQDVEFAESVSRAIRMVVALQSQLAPAVIVTSGPATSRTAWTRSRSPARSSPVLTFRPAHAQGQEPLGQDDGARNFERADHHFHRHIVMDPVAEQLVDGKPGRLAEEAPEVHLDGRSGERAQLDDPVHRGSRITDPRRVGTDQGAGDEVHDRRGARLIGLAGPERRDGGLARADQALVGVDLHDPRNPT